MTSKASLDSIRDAWSKEIGKGRDEQAARKLADEYVAANPDEFASVRDMTLEQCVQAVDVFRAAGMNVELQRVETWLLHHFEPQNIGGGAEAQVRIPNGN